MKHCNWPTVRLGDHVDLLCGFAFKSKQFTDNPDDIPLVKGANVHQGYVDWKDSKYWPKTEASQFQRYLLEPADVVLAMDRPWIEAGLKYSWIRGHDPRGLLVQRVARMRGVAGLESSFLRFLIGSHSFTDYIKPIVTGINVPHISADQIKGFRFPLPPLLTQRKIAGILSAYDDLIENNSRRIAIMEEMAQAIYREWFVHFRFPGHENAKFVDSPLGRIPEGWKVDSLGAVASVNARTIKKGQEPVEIAYVDIASVSTGRIDAVQPMPFVDSPGRARRIVRHGDVIWSTVRPNRRSYAVILNPPENMIVSTGFAVISGTSVPFTYLYQTLTTDDFVGYLVNHATGSAYPAVNSSDFEKALILIPPQQILDAFHDMTEPPFLARHCMAEKNKRLRDSRDLLLPKLISGQLDVEQLDIDMGELLPESVVSPATVSTISVAKPVIPPTTIKATPYKDDAAILCLLLDELGKLTTDRPNDEFVVQKHLFGLKHLRRLPVNSRFVSQKAGPWSQELRRKVFHAGIGFHWLYFDETSKQLTRGSRFAEGVAHARRLLGDDSRVVAELVQDLARFGKAGLGRWMTTFKVVCDLQEARTPVTRANIQTGVDHWPGKRDKPDFSVAKVDETITKMVRRNWFVLD